MATPAENPEDTPKKPVLGKIIYSIAVAVLIAVLLVSVVFYLRDQQGGPAPQPTTTAPTEPAVTAPPTVSSQPTAPSRPESPSQPEAPSQPEEPSQPAGPAVTDICLNTHSVPVYLIDTPAREYLAQDRVADVTAFLSRYWDTHTNMDRGLPVELSYTVKSLAPGISVSRAVFRLHKSDASGGYLELTPQPGEKKVLLYNLNTGMQYRYSVIITLSDGSEMTLNGSFRTVQGPRLMHIDGLVNVRDLGGWTAAGGRPVKQGLLYRGSEMDGMVEADFKLTDKGLEQMKALGIKTDFDLRHDGEDVIPGATHIYYNAIQYEHAFTEQGKEAVRKLFADLAKPENYPAYLHCTYGADRTGTMCYLLLGLLGVSDGDLKRDYELTALYYGYVSPELMDRFVERIGNLPGNSTRERVEFFLESAGVTQAQMDSIRQIFLG